MKKLIISTDSLRAALVKLGQAVATKPVLPVLSNLYLRARKHAVELITMDLELTILYVCSCECQEEFEMLIPFEFLKKVISYSGSIPLEIQLTSKTKGRIIGFEDSYQLNSLENIDDFPKIPEVPKKNSLQLDEVFMGWLDKAMAAVSTDDLRPAMTKACLDFTDKGVDIVATDAHSLFKHFFPVIAPTKEQLLISPKIAKAMKGFKATTLFWHSKHIAFKADNITVISTRHEDKYPDYRIVIPNHPANLPLNRNSLISALHRVALASSIYFTFKLFKSDINKVHLSADDLDFERRIEVDIAGIYNGSVDTVTFSPVKMLMLLNQIEFDEIYLHIDAPGRAALISSEEDPDYLAMLMPVSIS